jgi:hypothetical protein
LKIKISLKNKMAGRKNLQALRHELKALMNVHTPPPSSMPRAEVEHMVSIYQRIADMKKEMPKPEKVKRGRKQPREINEEEVKEEGIAVPKTPAKTPVDYTPKPKKVVAPVALDEDSGTGSESEAEQVKAKKSAKKVEKAVEEPKPKRVLSDEQKAKMKAGRDAKKAEVKKDTPPPEAPKKEEPKEEPKKIKLPVFKISS